MPKNEWIAADPANEVCPDFTSAIYAPVRDALLRKNDGTEEDIIATLVQMWTQEHDLCLARWAAQQIVDALAAEEEREQQQGCEEDNCQAAGKDQDPESEKGKLKFNDFDEDKPIPSLLLSRSLQYVLKKLEQGEYVELWYFSSDGYQEAKRDAHSTADDTFGISRSDDVLTLRLASAVKASKNVLMDHKLPMIEFL